MADRRQSEDGAQRQSMVYLLMFFGVVLLTAGCMVMNASVDTGDLLGEKQVSKIQPGRTTRSQLLNLLGPPNAVLRDGTKVMLPSILPSGEGTEELSYELAFLPFVEKYQSGPPYVVFYYQSIETSGYGVVVVAAATAKTNIQRKRLWVLVDEPKGVVADYAYRND